MTDYSFWFLLFLFCVAALYSSVGHGGASGYLALMAAYGFSPLITKPSALLLNIIVSLIAFILFFRQKFFRWSIFIPLALASVPAAFAGGACTIDTMLYKKILALLLLFPIIRFTGIIPERDAATRQAPVYLLLILGALIGFLSGLIGIGGGIILAPMLLLFRWADLKETAALSALFIFVNSISGMIPQFIHGIQYTSDIYLFAGVAALGGIAGAFFGSKKLNVIWLKRVLALVLVVASVKLFFT